MTANEIFDELLRLRKIEDLNSFSNPDYDSLADPFLLPDMAAAVDRICFSVKNKQKIAIYGDYDIDGMTATTILTDALKMFGADVVNFIPSRFIDGYGMGKRGVDELHALNVRLIITVDTGSLSHEHIDYAKSKDIDVIVTDHHSLGETLPNAVAIINPKREDSSYPYIDFAGVGVAFNLIRALQTKLEGIPKGQEKWFLDLVAMGTVCDVVPLDGENRTLVYWGIRVAQKTRRLGLKALATVSASELSSIDTSTFGFRFGPRLNASGRLDSAKLSMNLLSASSIKEAVELAGKLDIQNSQRRSIQDKIFNEALDQAKESNDPVLVVSGEGWSHGVVGIVASKILEEFEKPTFVLGIENGVATGSARSFGSYDLAKAIMSNKGVVTKGGGHAVAAGVTLPAENIDQFKELINAFFKDVELSREREHIYAKPDLILEDFSGLNEELLGKIKTLEPFGASNTQPLFRVKAKLMSWKPVGSSGSHVKVSLKDSLGNVRDGIGFNLAKKISPSTQIIDAVFHLEENEWNGRKTLQHRLINIA